MGALNTELIRLEGEDKKTGTGNREIILESIFFEVVHYDGYKGEFTIVKALRTEFKFYYKGYYDISTDERCIELFEPDEILALLALYMEMGKHLGKAEKAEEIRDCLEIPVVSSWGSRLA